MIPPNFRKLPVSHRQEVLRALFNLTHEEMESLTNKKDLSQLSDILVECSIGTLPLPFGLATGFLIDRRLRLIPMATEEPSVIAAACYAAGICRSGNGFKSWAQEPVMTTQIFLKDYAPQACMKFKDHEAMIHDTVDQLIPNMKKRGGGYRGMELEEKEGIIAVSIHIDVRDAMGANVINTVAEGLKEKLSALVDGRVLMSILTNASLKRTAGSSFEVPARLFRKGSLSGEEVCERIVEANHLANTFPERAVTHNKGIMNGITSLALATGNDTRAIEAGAHYYAQINGNYQTLTKYTFENGLLKGTIELPLAMGTVGGTIGVWPPSRLALKILDITDSHQLNRIGATLGLAQNLAALIALVTEGIQSGHMKLHSARHELTHA